MTGWIDSGVGFDDKMLSDQRNVGVCTNCGDEKDSLAIPPITRDTIAMPQSGLLLCHSQYKICPHCFQ